MNWQTRTPRKSLRSSKYVVLGTFKKDPTIFFLAMIYCILTGGFSNLGTATDDIGMRKFTIATAGSREREKWHREIGFTIRKQIAPSRREVSHRAINWTNGVTSVNWVTFFRMQEALTEQNKLKKQAENAEREFYSQKNEIASAHAEEKKMLVEVC